MKETYGIVMIDSNLLDLHNFTVTCPRIQNFVISYNLSPSTYNNFSFFSKILKHRKSLTRTGHHKNNKKHVYMYILKFIAELLPCMQKISCKFYTYLKFPQSIWVCGLTIQR